MATVAAPPSRVRALRRRRLIRLARHLRERGWCRRCARLAVEADEKVRK